MKKPKIIICQPIDNYFQWQIHLYVESCIEAGFTEEQIDVLLYKPKGREINQEYWGKLKEYYPKLNVYIYEDNGVQQYLGIYIPILRPHLLWQHFSAHPELENETILYTDCDILWSKALDIEKLFDDDICYVSDASSYMNHSYFLSKERQVLNGKLEEYKAKDVVKGLCDIVGIDKEIVIKNDKNTGGVQYILKNINADFWKKVQEDVLKIKIYLGQINKEFFKSTNEGIQDWCADLWAIQYNLWYAQKETKVVNEMSFSWSTDNLDRLTQCGIFHNAGVTGEFMDGVPYFYKGKYHQGLSPFTDPHLDVVLNNEESKKRCTWWYAHKLDELRKKYNLT